MLLDFVIPNIARHHQKIIVALATIQNVIAFAGQNDVVSSTANDHVIARAAINLRDILQRDSRKIQVVVRLCSFDIESLLTADDGFDGVLLVNLIKNE